MEKVVELLKHTKINDHTIELEKNKQPFFRLIYNLEQVKLETLKIYIKINLANSFIWSFKSPVSILILFNQKPNKSFHLQIDY